MAINKKAILQPTKHFYDKYFWAAGFYLWPQFRWITLKRFYCFILN